MMIATNLLYFGIFIDFGHDGVWPYLAIGICAKGLSGR